MDENKQETTKRPSRKETIPMPSQQARERFSQALREIRSGNGSSKIRMKEWCQNHEISPNSFRSWVPGSRNVSVASLVKLYKATKDPRFLYTEDERILYLTFHGKTKNDFPPEEDWPTCVEKTSESYLPPRHQPTMDEEQASSVKIEEDEENVPKEILQSARLQIRAFKLLSNPYPNTILNILLEEFREVLDMGALKKVRIYDIFSAVDELYLYVDAILKVEKYTEDETIFLMYLEMTLKVLMLRINAEERKAFKVFIQQCNEIFEKISDEFLADETLQEEEASYSGQFTNLLLLLTNVDRFASRKDLPEKLLERQKNYPYFGAKQQIKIMKKLHLKYPDWFKEWYETMTMDQTILGSK